MMECWKSLTVSVTCALGDQRGFIRPVTLYTQLSYLQTHLRRPLLHFAQPLQSLDIGAPFKHLLNQAPNLVRAFAEDSYPC
jgi:hypothetical protein